MELKRINCTACGSPIAISEDVEFINCAACGTFFAVQRGEGYIGLKAVEKITKAIQDTGQGTQEVIREGTQVTRAELQRLQITQEIAMAEMKLGNLQSEIRGLERGEKNAKAKNQVSSLRAIEYNTLEELRRMRVKAAALGPQDPDTRLKNAETELQLVNTQKGVLFQSNFASSQKTQIARALNDCNDQLVKEISGLRIYLFKCKLESFKTSELPLQNQADALAFIQLTNEDETKVYQMPYSPETSDVIQEIRERRTKVIDAWNRLENERTMAAEGQPVANTTQAQVQTSFGLSEVGSAGAPPIRTSKLALGSLIKGCLMGLVLTVVAFFIGFVIYGLLFSNTTDNLGKLGVGTTFLITVVGFGVGSFIFIRNVAPLTRIRGFGPVHDIVVKKNPKRAGLINPPAVKVLIGLITCVFIYAIFLSFMVMVPSESVGWVFCPGVLLGPMIAAFIAHRTYVAELEV